MKFVKNTIVTLFLLFTGLLSFAQESYPQDYFLFPINPGQRNYLAGTMGELRPNHFHGGLDIKTGGVEGLPVRAAADGYVSKIMVNSYGYGWVLYVAHPNGYTTVYAHLKQFRDDITSYVRSIQYNQESFSVELYPKNEMLQVHKGDTIAWSGNTGSSGGPHLHFEIRDKNNEALNPLLFGFSEIVDRTAPSFTKMAVACLDFDSRVDGQYGRAERTFSRVGNKYTVKDTIEAFGKIGVDFAGYDQLDGASNRNGITYVALICNNQVCFIQELEKFSFEKGRTFNTHIDYQNYIKTGNRFQHCFLEDGNSLGFYGPAINRGILNIEAGKIYEIKISAKDSYQNESTMEFVVKGVSPSLNKPTHTSSKWQPMSYTVDKNVIVMKVKNYAEYSSMATVCVDSSKNDIPVAYYEGTTAYYLWDLRSGLPDSVIFCDSVLYLDFREAIIPGKETTYSDSSIFIYFPPHCLFDTLYLDTEYDKENQIWRAGNILTPLFQNVSITLKGVDSLRHPKASVYEKKWNYNSYVSTTWTDTGAKFATRSLGKFVILKDEVAPTIKVGIRKSNYISFTIKDDRSGIGSYRATLDGKWIMMNYDHKRNLIYLDPYYWDKELKGEFKLVLKDNANNVSEYKTTFP